ncbi:hypothetical protein SNEBB_002853 [Seison nebaliae]|nr:hypothetical protein SNEBB_002853 [Seison nebaliae]
MKFLSIIALVFSLCLVGQVVEAAPNGGNGGNMFGSILSMLMNFWNGIKAAFSGEGSFGSGFTSEQSVEGTVDHSLNLASDTKGQAGGEFNGVHEGNVGGKWD